MPRQLKNLRIDEVSSVDRGAGKGVRVLLMKRDELAGSDGKREIHALKALELALTSIIGTGDTNAASVEKTVECFKQFHAFLNDDSKEKTMPLDVSKEDLETLIKGVVAGALKEAGVVKEDVDKKKDPKPVADDNEPDEDDAAKMLDKMFGEGSAKKIAELMNKKAPIEPVQKSEELAKRDAEIVDLRKHVHDLTERQAREDFAKRATSLGLVKEDGEKLRKAYAGDVAALGWMEETIRKLQTQVEKAGLFNEIGDNRGGAANITAHDELLAKAKEIQKADPKLTEASAYVRAMEVYPEIAKRESQERLAKVQKLA